MTNFYSKILFPLLVLIAAGSISFSQTREGAIRQMSEGNYLDAVKMLEALEEVYPGSYGRELADAERCLKLKKSAVAKFKAEHFTEAEELYKEILRINPFDKSVSAYIQKCQTARDEFLDKEFYKCKSILDYKFFSQKYPNSKQGLIAAKIVSDHEILTQEEASWKLADGHGGEGTIESYSQYLKTAKDNARHKKEAFRNRARLYFKQQEYSKALTDYDHAIELKCHLWREDEANYVICTAETKYAALAQSPSSTQVSDYLKWAKNYAEDLNVAPHLHVNEANGLLVKLYCRQGWFTSAKNHVGECFPNISPVSISGNGSIVWERKDWYSYIKQYEKLFKKNRFKHTKGVIRIGRYLILTQF